MSAGSRAAAFARLAADARGVDDAAWLLGDTPQPTPPVARRPAHRRPPPARRLAARWLLVLAAAAVAVWFVQLLAQFVVLAVTR